MTFRIYSAMSHVWLQEDRESFAPWFYGSAEFRTEQEAREFIAATSNMCDDPAVYVLDDGEQDIPDQRPLFDSEGRPIGGAPL